MKVLVLGASGFIGEAICHTFLRYGHIVYGQTRSSKTAEGIFSPNEILPVICDPFDEKGLEIWGRIAHDCDVG